MSDAEALNDIKAAIDALEKAIAGLNSGDQNGRDQFAWGLGFARGRLLRASERLYRQTKPPQPMTDWQEAKG